MAQMFSGKAANRLLLRFRVSICSALRSGIASSQLLFRLIDFNPVRLAISPEMELIWFALPAMDVSEVRPAKPAGIPVIRQLVKSRDSRVSSAKMPEGISVKKLLEMFNCLITVRTLRSSGNAVR